METKRKYKEYKDNESYPIAFKAMPGSLLNKLQKEADQKHGLTLTAYVRHLLTEAAKNIQP